MINTYKASSETLLLVDQDPDDSQVFQDELVDVMLAAVAEQPVVRGGSEGGVGYQERRFIVPGKEEEGRRLTARPVPVKLEKDIEHT